MPDLTSLLPILSALFVALGLILPGILKRDGYSDRVNQIITFAIIFVASIVQAAIQSKFGPDFAQDAAIVMTGMHVLLGVDGPFKSLDQFLQSHVNSGAKPEPLAQLLYEEIDTAKRPALQHPQAVPVVNPPADGSVIAPPPPLGG